MNKVVLNSELIATKAGNVTVYNYDGETREYIATSTEYLAVGVGIPACSCLDAPGSNKAGYAICRSADLNSWEYVPDHRGETVYSTETGESKEITAPGDYPENTTTIAPLTPYDKWDGEKWVTDTEAQHTDAINRAENERQQLLKHADAVMLDWRTALMLGEISDNNRAKLSAWLAYKNEVKAVDVTSGPEHVNWPGMPEV
ncbi:tail fiber assembly protein [Escherichia coli]|nr:tail fiber assembly protein [Escherichia coli]